MRLKSVESQSCEHCLLIVVGEVLVVEAVAASALLIVDVQRGLHPILNQKRSENLGDSHFLFPMEVMN